MHTRAAIRDGSHKSELVRDLYIVQQPSRSVEKNSKQPDHTKSNKNNTKNKQTKQPTQTKQTSNLESDRRSSPETNEEGEVITLYQLRYWYGRKQDKRENRKHKKHIAIPPCEWSNTALCGNQGSPQPGSPRSHRASHQGITTHNKRTLRC